MTSLPNELTARRRTIAEDAEASLRDAGLWDDAMRPLVQSYAASVVQAEHLQAEAEKHDPASVVARQHFAGAQRARKDASTTANRLGLTPLARARAGVQTEAEQAPSFLAFVKEELGGAVRTERADRDAFIERMAAIPHMPGDRSPDSLRLLYGAPYCCDTGRCDCDR